MLVPKMDILPKPIYSFKAIPIEIPMTSFKEPENNVLKFIWENKLLRIPKVILSNKRNTRDIRIADLKLYYRATVKNTVWYWHKTDMKTSGIE